ncbi:MAG: hypothetical protein WDW38_004789 [Sanguina aurantia]
MRKNADRADTHRFFGVVTCIFLTLSALLVASELLTFFVNPTAALSWRFLYEIYRSVNGVLQLPVMLFYEMQDIAWTINAIFYGADFELRGLQVTRGIAMVLLWANVTLAAAMTGFLLLYAALCAQTSAACLRPRRLGVRVGAICAPTLAYYCFALLTTRSFWRPGPQTATCLGVWTAVASLFMGWRSVASLIPGGESCSGGGPEAGRRTARLSSCVALQWCLGVWGWMQLQVAGKARQRGGGGSVASAAPPATARRRTAAAGSRVGASHGKHPRGGHASAHPTSGSSSSSGAGAVSGGGGTPLSAVRAKLEPGAATSHPEATQTSKRGGGGGDGVPPTSKHGSNNTSACEAPSEPSPCGHKPPPAAAQANSKPSAAPTNPKQAGGGGHNTKASQKADKASGNPSPSSSSSNLSSAPHTTPAPNTPSAATPSSQAAQQPPQGPAPHGKHATSGTAAHPPPPPPPPPITPSPSSSRAAATGRQLASLVMRNAAKRASTPPDSSASSKAGQPPSTKAAQHPLAPAQGQPQHQQRPPQGPPSHAGSSSLGALFGGLTGRGATAAVPPHHPGVGHSYSHHSGKPIATAAGSHASSASAAMQQQRALGSPGGAPNGGAHPAGRASFTPPPPPPSSSLVRPAIGTFAAAAAAGVAVLRAAVTPSLLMPTNPACAKPPAAAAAPPRPSASPGSPLAQPLKASGKGSSKGSSKGGHQPSQSCPSTPSKQQQQLSPAEQPPPPPPPHTHSPTCAFTNAASGFRPAPPVSSSPKPLNPSAPAFRYNPFISPPTPAAQAAAAVPAASYSPTFDEQQRAYQQQDYNSYNLLHKQEQDLWHTVAGRHTSNPSLDFPPFSLEQQQHDQRHDQQRAADGLSFFTSGPMFSEQLVAHKHASGDLDLSSAAANYRPFSAEQRPFFHVPGQASEAAAPPAQPPRQAVTQNRTMHGRAPGSDSEFSFFSTPPPSTTPHLPSSPAVVAAPAAAHAFGILSLGVGFAEQQQQQQQRTLEEQQYQRQLQSGLFDAPPAPGGAHVGDSAPWFYGGESSPYVSPVSAMAAMPGYPQGCATHGTGSALAARLVLAASPRQSSPGSAAAAAAGLAGQQQQQQAGQHRPPS